MYVRGYGPIEPAPPARLFMPVENCGVEYSKTSEWRVSLFHADYELRTLQDMHVRVGEHYCDFALENLAEDCFAIVCESHPPLRDKSAA